MRSPSHPKEGKEGGLIGFLEEHSASLVPHLSELRIRLIASVIAVVAGSVVGWMVSPRVLQAFQSSVGSLIFIKPTEALVVRMKMALFIGLVLVGPVVVYQIWRFVEPGLLPREKRAMTEIMMMGTALFVGGTFFGYVVVYPTVLSFFLAFGTDGLTPAMSIGHYFRFFIGTTVSFGLAFQLPTVLLTFVRIGLLSADRLIAWRRQALFTAFVVAALLTPADVLSQFLMAIPLILLYEGTVLLAPRFEKRDHRV